MEIDRKNRTRRLIQLGALAEKYLHCEGVSPEEFESRLKCFTSPPMMDCRAIYKFLYDLSCLAGKGNGVDPGAVAHLKELAIMFGYLPEKVSSDYAGWGVLKDEW